MIPLCNFELFIYILPERRMLRSSSQSADPINCVIKLPVSTLKHRSIRASLVAEVEVGSLLLLQTSDLGVDRLRDRAVRLVFGDRLLDRPSLFAVGSGDAVVASLRMRRREVEGRLPSCRMKSCARTTADYTTGT